MSFVITIDGPAASGKTSVSRELAKRLKCDWVSTGAFYRGLAYVALEMKIDLEKEGSLVDLISSREWVVKVFPDKTRVFFKENEVTDEIQKESVGNVASRISQYPMVRKALLEPQRRCLTTKGLVAEGRDCGSVVFPHAQLKIYLTADSENRAQRRAQEKGASKEEIKKLQKTRDNQDLNRTVAPLKTPDNAHVVDTSKMNLNEVVDYIANLAQSIL